MRDELSDKWQLGLCGPGICEQQKRPPSSLGPLDSGFSREFVQGAFERHLLKKGTVLDPFAGVGTTLVEAILAGHEAIGFEINPYAALACRTKLNAHHLASDEVARTAEAFQKFYRHTIKDETYLPKSTPPPGFKSRVAFYSPQVLRKVLIVHDFITSLEEETLRDIFRIAFASTMVRYSNYSYEPSLGTRVAAGKEDITDFPVGKLFAMDRWSVCHDRQPGALLVCKDRWPRNTAVCKPMPHCWQAATGTRVVDEGALCTFSHRVDFYTAAALPCPPCCSRMLKDCHGLASMLRAGMALALSVRQSVAVAPVHGGVPA